MDLSMGQNQQFVDRELSLNQAQIINAVKRFYGERTGLDPRVKMTKVALSSKKNKGL